MSVLLLPYALVGLVLVACVGMYLSTAHPGVSLRPKSRRWLAALLPSKFAKAARRLGRLAPKAIVLRGEDVGAADGARPVAGAHVARAAAAAEAAWRGEAARRDPRLRRRAPEAGLQGRGREGARAMSDARRRGGERGARRATRRTIFDAKTLAWQLGHVQSPGRTSPPPPPKPPSSNCEYGAPPPKPPYAPGSPCTPSSDRPATFAATEAGSSGTGLRERLRAAEGRSPGFRSASRSRAPRGATCNSEPSW